MSSATPKWIIYIVVGTLSFLSMFGTITLAVSQFYNVTVERDLILITTGAVSALTAILVNTRQPTTNGTTTTTTSTPPAKVITETTPEQPKP